MIAPVKKFARVRPEYHFPSKQIWRRMRTWEDDEFLLDFEFPASKRQGKIFKYIFNRILDIRRRDV